MLLFVAIFNYILMQRDLWRWEGESDELFLADKTEDKEDRIVYFVVLTISSSITIIIIMSIRQIDHHALSYITDWLCWRSRRIKGRKSVNYWKEAFAEITCDKLTFGTFVNSLHPGISIAKKSLKMLLLTFHNIIPDSFIDFSPNWFVLGEENPWLRDSLNICNKTKLKELIYYAIYTVMGRFWENLLLQILTQKCKLLPL